LIFYVVYLFRMARPTEAGKILWALFLFMGNVIAFPLLFYFYLWREAPGRPEFPRPPSA
jgi:hypothetical protein